MTTGPVPPSPEAPATTIPTRAKQRSLLAITAVLITASGDALVGSSAAREWDAQEKNGRQSGSWLAASLRAGLHGKESPQFTDWRIPASEVTATIAHPLVPIEDRRDVVTIEPELMIGDDPTDPNQLFYRANAIAVDASGRIYVNDAGNHRIQVFDPSGDFVMSLGREGQGPGEFSHGSGLVVGGDRLMVYEGSRRRLLTWDLSGEIGEEVRLEGAGVFESIGAMADGFLIFHHSSYSSNAAGTTISAETVVQSFDPVSGRAGAVFLRGRSRTPDPRSPDTAALVPGAPSLVTYAVDPSGVIYVATREGYNVHAFSTSGAPQWVLRVSDPRKQDRPIRLSSLAVDGHGHLYVYIAFGTTLEERAAVAEEMGLEFPAFAVDVYSRDGARLFSGAVGGPVTAQWYVAAGEHVYQRIFDEAGEPRIIRARLREPF